MSHAGELAAIATAVSWTGSSLFFGYASRRAGGTAVNTFRILCAVPVLVLLHVLVLGAAWPVAMTDERLLRLAASGIVGLVLGDLGYFHALALIGPRISSVLMATWPAMALGLGVAGAGDSPTATDAIGVAMTTAGVVLVLLRAREGSAWNAALTPRQRATAVLGALCGAFGQALGTVLARPALQPGPDAPDGTAPLTATLVRMAAAAVAMLLLALAQRRPNAFAHTARQRAVGFALLGTAFGPVIGVWLSMLAVQQARGTGVAAALMSLTPLFMMPVAWFAYRARIGWFGLCGTLLTVAGGIVLLLPEA